MRVDYKHTAIEFIFRQIDEQIQQHVQNVAKHQQQAWNDKNPLTPRDFFAEKELIYIESMIVRPLAIALYGYLNPTDAISKIEFNLDHGQPVVSCVVTRDGKNYSLFTHIVYVAGYIKEAHYRYRLECELHSKVATPYKNYWERKDGYESDIKHQQIKIAGFDRILRVLEDVENYDPILLLEIPQFADNFAYTLHQKSEHSSPLETRTFYTNLVDLPKNKRKRKSYINTYTKEKVKALQVINKTQTKLNDLIAKIHG